MRKTILIFLLFLSSSALFAQKRSLDFYLEQAKANSPLLNKNRNDAKIVDLDLQQMERILNKPEISLDASVLFAPIVSRDNNKTRFEWISNGANDYYGYDLALTDGGQYQASVSLKQPLFTGSHYQSYSNKATISRQMSENGRALTEHEIEQVVAYQYLLCLKSKKQSEISLLLLKALDDQLVIMKKLVEHAIYKQTDLMLMQIEYQNYKAELQTYNYEFLNGLYDLNLICGINDSSVAELQDVDFQLNPQLATRSQFLKAYTLDSLNVLADLSLFDLKYKPQINAVANAGLNAVYLPDISRLGLSTGISLSWNLFDGNQHQIQMEKSTIQLQTIEFEKQNFETQNAIYKNKSLNLIKSLQSRLANLDEQINQYDQLFQTFSQELAQGLISIMDFKNLVKDISAKKQEKLLLKMEEQSLINSYNYWNF